MPTTPLVKRLLTFMLITVLLIGANHKKMVLLFKFDSIEYNVSMQYYYPSELCFGKNVLKHGTLPFQNGAFSDPKSSPKFLPREKKIQLRYNL